MPIPMGRIPARPGSPLLAFSSRTARGNAPRFQRAGAPSRRVVLALTARSLRVGMAGGANASRSGVLWSQRMNAPANPIENEQPGLGVRLPYQLGRFTLCRELGAGGMATVYLGRMRLAEGFERLVALKTIHGHLAQAQTFVDMFLDEAKIASQISHPNVCSVYDFGNVDGTYYLALEYLMGEPLDDVIKRRSSRRESDDLMQALPYLAARIIADACEGAARRARDPRLRRARASTSCTATSRRRTSSSPTTAR